MKQTIILLAFLPLFSLAQQSTASWEIGGYVGGLSYSGEVTKEGDLGTWINEMKPEFGVLLKRNFNSIVGFGAQASYGKLYALDKNHGNPERGWVVNTEIVQANLFLEMNFRKFGKYFKRNKSTPYVKVGAGILFYSPKLDDDASYPLNYELFWGSYSTYNIDLAFGWKWRLSHHSLLSLDIHYNPTGTDHIEGFQQKGGPNGELVADPDSYYGLRLTYTYSIFK